MANTSRPKSSKAAITSVALDEETRMLMKLARNILSDERGEGCSQSEFLRLAAKALAVGVIKTTGTARTESSYEVAQALGTLITAINFEQVELIVSAEQGRGEQA